MSKYQGISTLEILTDAKNYNKWISDCLSAHIAPPALEIGAGIGNITQLYKNIKHLYITDTDPLLVKELRSRFKKEKNIVVKQLDITGKTPSNFKNFFKSIYAVNVLEHIQDDEKALRNILTMLKPGGKLILLVPAKKFAYTKLDRELGHFRRYEKKELTNKLIDSGYKINTIRFFNFVGLFSWYVRDKVNKKNFNLKPHHIKIFDSIVPVLRIIESIIRIPIGISLIFVAEKSKK
jgi:SAM-dependent methyltransferase